MTPDAPREARWVRPEPRRAIPAEEAERMVRHAFPRGRVVRVEPLAGGLRNANFKLTLDSIPKPIVLRVYEHDASLCRKEADLIRLIGGSVPVPEVILAEPAGEGVRPFMLQRYVEGPTFRELVGSARSDEVAEAAHSAGETLAAIGCVMFETPGWFAPGPTVTDPLLEGCDPIPRFVDACLAAPMLQKRLPAELCDKTQAAMWKQAALLRGVAGETSLVHGDFGRRNLIVRQLAGRWVVAVNSDSRTVAVMCPLWMSSPAARGWTTHNSSFIIGMPPVSGGRRRRDRPVGLGTRALHGHGAFCRASTARGPGTIRGSMPNRPGQFGFGDNTHH